MNVAGTKAVLGKNAESISETWQWPQSDLLVITFFTVMLIRKKSNAVFTNDVLLSLDSF